MKSTGYEKRLDPLGRIVLPIGIRKSLGIEYGDKLQIFVDGNTIVLEKCADSCIFCGSDQSLIQFGEKHICAACKKELAK